MPRRIRMSRRLLMCSQAQAMGLAHAFGQGLRRPPDSRLDLLTIHRLVDPDIKVHAAGNAGRRSECPDLEGWFCLCRPAAARMRLAVCNLLHDACASALRKMKLLQ